MYIHIYIYIYTLNDLALSLLVGFAGGTVPTVGSRCIRQHNRKVVAVNAHLPSTPHAPKHAGLLGVRGTMCVFRCTHIPVEVIAPWKRDRGAGR